MLNLLWIWEWEENQYTKQKIQMCTFSSNLEGLFSLIVLGK